MALRELMDSNSLGAKSETDQSAHSYRSGYLIPVRTKKGNDRQPNEQKSQGDEYVVTYESASA